MFQFISCFLENYRTEKEEEEWRKSGNSVQLNQRSINGSSSGFLQLQEKIKKNKNLGEETRP